MTFLLCNKDAPSNKLAATLRLAQVITNQTEIEEEASFHLANLSR